jgi:hypothetical protein
MRPRLILRPRNRYLDPLLSTRERRGYPSPQKQEQRKESNITKDTNLLPLIDSSGYMVWPPEVFPPPGIDPIDPNKSTTSDIELDTRQNPWESNMPSHEKRESFFFCTTSILMCIYTLLTIKIMIDTDVPEIAEALFLFLAISVLCRIVFPPFICGVIVTLCFQLVWALTTFSFGKPGLSWAMYFWVLGLFVVIHIFPGLCGLDWRWTCSDS